MKIVICGSILFTEDIRKISAELKSAGHQTEIPLTSQKIISGELTMDEFKKEKESNGDSSFRKIQDDVIKRYYDLIADSDCVLVINIEKNGIPGYIGGNTFLEMGFAHVLNKPIYLLNQIPDMGYRDEIVAMRPIVINNDLNKINSSAEKRAQEI